MQSVPITTKVVSLNPAHGKVYLIQHYVIKLVSVSWWLFMGTQDTNKKTDCQDITEMLLTMIFNTITLILTLTHLKNGNGCKANIIINRLTNNKCENETIQEMN